MAEPEKNEHSEEQFDDLSLEELLRGTCDLTPAGIIRKLDLHKPVYAATAAKGHFGVEGKTWEQTDLAETLKKLV